MLVFIIPNTHKIIWIDEHLSVILYIMTIYKLWHLTNLVEVNKWLWVSVWGEQGYRNKKIELSLVQLGKQTLKVKQ